MITLFHYARVAYYQLIKPRLWRNLVQTRALAASEPKRSAIQPLFFDAEDHAHLSKKLSDCLSEERILKQAQDAILHRFAIFSEVAREHGSDIAWHKDYASGKEWDKTKSAHLLDFMHSEGNSDVKYPWDLNRCYWFTWLGMAHILHPNDTRYVHAFANDVESWTAANPLGRGINWAMPMEVAIRATNWIVAYSFFYTSPTLSEDFHRLFLRTLWQHGMFLSYNLEYVRHNANHFSSNAMGLVVLGAFFYRTREGKSWFRRGKRFLEREILLQFTKDGVNFEKSTSYHRFVVEMMSIAGICAEQVQSPFSTQFYERLTAACSYIAAYTRPDASAPMIGDNDNGRVIKPHATEDFNNHLQILILSSTFLGRLDILEEFTQHIRENSTETALLRLDFQQDTSATSSKHRPHITRHKSNRTGEAYFIQGGYIVHKSAQSHLIIDVGDYGMDGWGGHGHNDCLSLEFWLRGETILTDSGTGCYTSNRALRDSLRSTKAHNTVMLGGKEQTEWLPSSLWRIQNDELAPNVLEVRSGKQGAAEIFVLSAEHSAYRQRFGTIHRRSMKLHSTPNNGTLTIIDEIIPVEQAMIGINGKAHYHFPAEVLVSQNDARTLLLTTPSQTITFTAKSPIFLERCNISRFYGDVRETWRCSIECSLDAASEVVLRW